MILWWCRSLTNLQTYTKEYLTEKKICARMQSRVDKELNQGWPQEWAILMFLTDTARLGPLCTKPNSQNPVLPPFDHPPNLKNRVRKIKWITWRAGIINTHVPCADHQSIHESLMKRPKTTRFDTEHAILDLGKQNDACIPWSCYDKVTKPSSATAAYLVDLLRVQNA